MIRLVQPCLEVSAKSCSFSLESEQTWKKRGESARREGCSGVFSWESCLVRPDGLAEAAREDRQKVRALPCRIVGKRNQSSQLLRSSDEGGEWVLGVLV